MDGANLAAIKTVMDDNGSWGGGGWLWLFVLAFIFMGGGLFGGGRQAATNEELAAGFANSANLNRLNDLMLGQANINQNLGNAIYTSTYELGSKIDGCCCNTQLGIQQLRADIIAQGKDLAATIHAEGEATRNQARETENANLRQENMFAKMRELTCGIPRVNPFGYGVFPYQPCNNPCGNVYAPGM